MTRFRGKYAAEPCVFWPQTRVRTRFRGPECRVVVSLSGPDTFPMSAWVARGIRRCRAWVCIGFLRQNMSATDHAQHDDLHKGCQGGSALKIVTVLWQASDDEHLTVDDGHREPRSPPGSSTGGRSPGPARSARCCRITRSSTSRSLVPFHTRQHITSVPGAP